MAIFKLERGCCKLEGMAFKLGRASAKLERKSFNLNRKFCGANFWRAHLLYITFATANQKRRQECRRNECKGLGEIVNC